ncbi:integrase [Paraeggerthella hongkongensis]|uniref:site-specific tyrosine recombinase/integron integrase n=1 Tax=Paraeggerthella sp. TaxID=2897350 RepID=UPI000DF803DE|nr:integrase [Paraeggerthella hongkongensis]
MHKTANEIERLMAPVLDGAQLRHLRAVLASVLYGGGDSKRDVDVTIESQIEKFLAAKRLEGCSERSLAYYSSTLKRFAQRVSKPTYEISTSVIRDYLSGYQGESCASSVTIDNIRRIISSFFSWLEEEGFIYKSPVKRIKKIRTSKPVKPVYTDESLEVLRDSCENTRDLAIIDLLASAGIRVGELVKLDSDDIDFESRECIVHGKGSKERRVYFDARAKVHLQAYLDKRDDDNPALFVSLNNPHNRLEISGVEARLRNLGRNLEMPRVYPHKFRRTLATKAIEKGMPIEQVQVLLGHSKIDTTLCYAMVDQENVKQSHRKYIG